MKVISANLGEGNRVGLLVKSSHKYHHVIFIDNPIRSTKLPLSYERYFNDVMYKGKEYPVDRAIKKLRGMVMRWHKDSKNVSKSVRDALNLNGK